MRCKGTTKNAHTQANKHFYKKIKDFYLFVPFISQWELARKNPIFCVLLYIIVVLNTQRLGAFVLNIGAFCGNEDIYDMWKLLYYKHFRVGVFFLKKVFEC